MVDIHIAKTGIEAARKAASAIEGLISGFDSESILLLLSGGSPLEILKYLSPAPFDNRVTVSVSDERVSHDAGVNNFAQIMATRWYKAIQDKGIQHIDTRPATGETAEAMGVRFDAAIKSWKEENPMGKIIITQGIGLDGHTAGMMPANAGAPAGKPSDANEFRKLFENPDIWAMGYDAQEKNRYPLRVTVTMPFLRMIDHSIVYVCGSDKARPLAAVLAPTGTLAAVPARIIRNMKHCLLFTDQPVATVLA